MTAFHSCEQPASFPAVDDRGHWYAVCEVSVTLPDSDIAFEGLELTDGTAVQRIDGLPHVFLIATTGEIIRRIVS